MILATETSQGAWVRYCIGTEDHSNVPVYRACEVVGELHVCYAAPFPSLSLATEVAPRLVKTYRINDQPANQELILRHGGSEKNFLMDKISNTEISEVRRGVMQISVCLFMKATERVQPNRPSLPSRETHDAYPEEL